MSTRSTIWLGKSEGKEVHIYWELAERVKEGGRMVAAPIYISVDEGDSNREVKARLPKETGETLLLVLCPDYTTRFAIGVI